MTDWKKTLYARVNDMIKDSEIKLFTIQALNNVEEQFWSAASSSTGKYHPPENNIVSGLVIHTIKLIDIIEPLTRHYNLSEIDRDYCISGGALHDISKYGKPWGKWTHKAHGTTAAEYIDQFQLNNDKKEIIKDIVRYHMKHYGTESKEKYTLNEQIVQMADMISSAKEVSYLPKKIEDLY